MKSSMFRWMVSVVCLWPLYALAVDVPQPRTGLWETRIKLTTNKKSAAETHILRVCVDPKTGARDKADADEYVKQNCTKYTTRRIGADWVTNSVCSLGASVVTGHMVMRFSGDNAYQVQTDTAYAPALAGKIWTRMVVDAKRLGACIP